MKLLLPSQETPREGRFSFPAFKYALVPLLLFASWMVSLHIPPWVGWHNEILVFAAGVWVAGIGLLDQRICNRPFVHFPRAIWALVFLGAVVVVQFVSGRIDFFGDALVLIAYLLLCAVALGLGFELGAIQPAGDARETSRQSLLIALAVLLITAGFFSVMFALVQALDLWESATWITPMQFRRPGGNLGQPNHLATLLLFCIASAAYLHACKLLRTFLGSLVALVLLLGLAITESRTGALGFFAIVGWYLFKRCRGLILPTSAVVLWMLYFALWFWFWPACLNFIFIGGLESANGLVQVSTEGGTRLLVWPQLWRAVLLRPWFGWGLREVSEALNAVASLYSRTDAFTYAHNIALDLAIGIGLPGTVLLIAVSIYWFIRRARAVNDPITWYCVAVVLPLAIHSMLEYPFAYAYLLAPVMVLIGVLEARLAPEKVFRIPWRLALAVWFCASALTVLSVREYIAIEEDFRVARFEALRTGKTPDDYERPRIILLTQLDALLEGARIVPVPGMAIDRIELARRVALRFPYPATQNRYALALALNGNPDEAMRQLKVMHAMFNGPIYDGVKVNWVALAKDKYPQLAGFTMP